MRGKNQAAVQRGLSSGSVDMNLFNDDPLLQGMAMFGNGGLLLSHTPPNIGPGSYEVCVYVTKIRRFFIHTGYNLFLIFVSRVCM